MRVDCLGPALLVLFSGQASAAANIDTKLPALLKDFGPQAMKYVADQANAQGTVIAKRLAEVNAKGTNGKNPNGIFSLPVKSADLSSLVVGGSFTDNLVKCSPNAENPKQKDCENDQAVEVLVSIPSRSVAEVGVDYGNLSFLVSIARVKTWSAELSDNANHPVGGPPKTETRFLNAIEIPMEPY